MVLCIRTDQFPVVSLTDERRGLADPGGGTTYIVSDRTSVEVDV